MKTLSKLIKEKLYHQQVDEKLIINKNLRNTDAFLDCKHLFMLSFYEDFGDDECFTNVYEIDDIKFNKETYSVKAHAITGVMSLNENFNVNDTNNVLYIENNRNGKYFIRMFFNESTINEYYILIKYIVDKLYGGDNEFKINELTDIMCIDNSFIEHTNKNLKYKLKTDIDIINNIKGFVMSLRNR